jgi:hypothetical protein
MTDMTRLLLIWQEQDIGFTELEYLIQLCNTSYQIIATTNDGSKVSVYFSCQKAKKEDTNNKKT